MINNSIALFEHRLLARDNAGNQKSKTVVFTIKESDNQAVIDQAKHWVDNLDEWNQHCGTEVDPVTGRKPSDNTDCGNFVGDVIQATVDPNFPEQGTSVLYEYITDEDNGWIWGNLSDSDPKPGDVLLVTKSQQGSSYGHTSIFVGVINGDYVTYEGSLGNHQPEERSYSRSFLNQTFKIWARPKR